MNLEPNNRSLSFCHHRFTRTGNTRNEGVTVKQFSAIDHNHILADRVVTDIQTVLVAYLLNVERHKYGKALGGKRSSDTELGTAVGQAGIESFKLLPTKYRHRAKVLSRALQNALGIE